MSDTDKQINEKKIAQDMLERYSGSAIEEFCPYLLLTNFAHYTHVFAETYQVPISKGSMFSAAHAPQINISILDFKLGSPGAALTMDLCSFLPNAKAAVMLGMCGGLRSHYQVGDYFVPIASIRGEGTSDIYFPPEVPALANFIVQKTISEVLEERKASYHIGITQTTNIRFWEFNTEFRKKLYENKAQTIEMECATLFSAGYRRNLPIGALLIISDLPLRKEGIKTKKSGKFVLDTFTHDHIDVGVKVVSKLNFVLKNRVKSKGLPHMEPGESDDIMPPGSGISDQDY
ncbi:AMP nucleosidase [Chlamydia gallinacea]|uniref:AMP nucleosidase n=2 Tax=Chlamydia gallinacea TaxID=1457153 RepID=A0A173DYC7_9CHLA|nr:AMP nucleosidase [Chlamydia gallinacea]EYE60751.1 putative AMP nucleosidase [Bacteroides fragilis str. S6L5]ANG65939.1 AMP nucleosidase [Chlamydia gallinacea 08-1274/3]AQT77824.1 AMP nucleosidase [Chlamydia gallinacea]MBX6680591.1 AMP nucleosidase [Chlamydia gallinacea]MBX6687382.1 AMP nucleosidase [Chlamydia gallinacea]